MSMPPSGVPPARRPLADPWHRLGFALGVLGSLVVLGLGLLWQPLVLVALMAYRLPALVAVARRHHQCYAIAALNLLLGWTLLGWVLVWALTATPGRR